MKLSPKASKKSPPARQEHSLNAIKIEDNSSYQLGYSENSFNFLINANSDLVMLITEPEEEESEG
jgi:hypothetical protein